MKEEELLNVILDLEVMARKVESSLGIYGDYRPKSLFPRDIAWCGRMIEVLK